MLSGKRMVMAGEFSPGTTGEALAHGLRAQGWDVLVVDQRLFLGQRGSPVIRAVSRLTRPWSIRSYNDAILEAVEQIKPHAFLTVKGIWLRAKTLERIASRNAVLLNYYPDRDFDHAGLDRSTFPLFHLFMTTKSFQLEYLRNLLGPARVALVYHGYNDLMHFPRSKVVAEAEFLADVSYVGNYSPFKEKWLRSIVQRLPDISIRIVGSRWELAQDLALKKCVLGNVLIGDFYARAVQHSRINIAVHSGPHPPEGWQDLVSTRTFEIPACKGFMLHVDNAEVRSMFELDREIDVFANEIELVEKISYYLAKPALRAEMIERAYARCVPGYGYNARAAVISDKIRSLLKKREALV